MQVVSNILKHFQHFLFLGTKFQVEKCSRLIQNMFADKTLLSYNFPDFLKTTAYVVWIYTSFPQIYSEIAFNDYIEKWRHSSAERSANWYRRTQITAWLSMEKIKN